MTTMTVAYKVFQTVEIDVMDALKEKLPPHADITYVGNQNTGEVLWSEDWD